MQSYYVKFSAIDPDNHSPLLNYTSSRFACCQDAVDLRDSSDSIEMRKRGTVVVSKRAPEIGPCRGEDEYVNNADRLNALEWRKRHGNAVTC